MELLKHKTAMKIKLIILWFFSLVIIFFFIATKAAEISNYHPTFIPLYDHNGNLEVAIRQFEKAQSSYFLVVNPETFATKIDLAKNFSMRKANSLSIAEYALANTPYMMALEKYTHLSPHLLQNDGMRRAEESVDGIFLTVDLCPSSRSFEGHFFETLALLSFKRIILLKLQSPFQGCG